VAFGAPLRKNLRASIRRLDWILLCGAQHCAEKQDGDREQERTTTAQAAVTSDSPLHVSFDAGLAKCDVYVRAGWRKSF
jgi:hypothetical protein